MRLTGGELRGRTLRFPAGSKERPTSDFLREALFNLLGTQQDKLFLDLFAGSGSVGLEAVSRGAKEVYFLEKNSNLATVIEKNIQACRLENKCSVIKSDIEKGLNQLLKKNYVFDVIFADPPYNRNLVEKTLDLLNKNEIFNKDSIIVIQHSNKEGCSEFAGNHLYWTDQRKYGENALTFFKWRENDAG
jgi:16S rRNA (guanine966-N2)-methyltransferase